MKTALPPMHTTRTTIILILCTKLPKKETIGKSSTSLHLRNQKQKEKSLRKNLAFWLKRLII